MFWRIRFLIVFTVLYETFLSIGFMSLGIIVFLSGFNNLVFLQILLGIFLFGLGLIVATCLKIFVFNIKDIIKS